MNFVERDYAASVRFGYPTENTERVLCTGFGTGGRRNGVMGSFSIRSSVV